MNDVTILLAAHGAGDASPSNDYIRRLVDSLKDTLGSAQITCAFRKGAPSFADALSAVETHRIIVIPIMTSEGYFSKRILPASLAESPQFANLDVRITPPLGMHDGLIDITASLFEESIVRWGLKAPNSTLIVVGHGTRQHARSRCRTADVAEAILAQRPDWDVRAAFIDESPFVNEVAASLRDRNIIAVPFLIGGGHHALIDIPDQLGICTSAMDDEPPFVTTIEGRLRICTQAVGMHAKIPSLVRDIAMAHLTNSTAGAM
ncbi:MAG: ferrochelatase [Phycisphaerales bacterium]|nr:ferrochelatase [Phycisphaerales bacterium]MCB9862414.1 ferrochelatase [Phycisphaerales bacterium]